MGLIVVPCLNTYGAHVCPLARVLTVASGRVSPPARGDDAALRSGRPSHSPWGHVLALGRPWPTSVTAEPTAYRHRRSSMNSGTQTRPHRHREQGVTAGHITTASPHPAIYGPAVSNHQHRTHLTIAQSYSITNFRVRDAFKRENWPKSIIVMLACGAVKTQCFPSENPGDEYKAKQQSFLLKESLTKVIYITLANSSDNA